MLDLSRREPFTHALTHLSELLDSERSNSLLVEDLKQLLQTGLVLVVTAETEDLQEGLEVHLDVGRLCVHDLQYLPGFLFESQGLDGRGQLLSADVTALVVVEDVKALLETSHVVSRQVLSRVD